jgi:hypothetical protein
MSKREIYFAQDGEDLIPEGSKIKVNDYNSEVYCNKIALKAIG